MRLSRVDGPVILLSFVLVFSVFYSRRVDSDYYVQAQLSIEDLRNKGYDLSAYNSTLITISDPDPHSHNESIDIYSDVYFDDVRKNNTKINFSSLRGRANKLVPIKGFKNVYTSYRVTPEHKLISCGIPKTMSTLMASFQCAIQHPELPMANYPYCDKKIRHYSTAEIMEKYSLTTLEDWKFIFVIRDPMDRFLSGFLDRCVRLGRACFGCYSNMECYLENLYKVYSQVGNTTTSLTFDEYHLTPLTWSCDIPHNWKQMKFLRYSNDPSQTLLGDLLAFFKEQGVPKTSLNKVKHILLNTMTAHSTIKSPIRKYFEDLIDNSSYLYQLIMLIYDSDYKVFDFS